MRISDEEFRKVYSKVFGDYKRRARDKSVGASFFTDNQLEMSSTSHSKFMMEDLARSGLDEQHMMATVDPMLKMYQDAQAGYKIHYFNLDGSHLEKYYRIRFKRPAFSIHQRYLGPKGSDLNAAGLYTFYPYIHPLVHSLPGDTIYCCEGEKKSVAFMRALGLPTFGIGGCQMWGSGGKLHPWIPELMSMGQRKNIVIIPDGDIRKHDISRAYNSFFMAMRQAGFQVTLMDPPGKIDDLIVEWGGSVDERWAEVPVLDPKSLIRPAHLFIDEYDLSYKIVKEARIVHQNISNIHNIMTHSPGFGAVWTDMDAGKVMIGDEICEPDNTEVGITREFQHFFCLERVTHKMVQTVLGEMARKDKRSPFLDAIRDLRWDGTPRLSTWLQRLWGVGDSEHVRELGVKWLVSSCARQAQPGTYVAWMLIVIGPQAIGKTTMPKVLFGDLAKLVAGKMDDKDLKNLMHSGLCMNFDEMDTLGGREMSELKSMITNSVDSYRPPYASGTSDYPRRFILYGCGNDSQFLRHDPTGQRRYGIVTAVSKMDFKTLEEEKDQMWAEAWRIYQGGECDYGNLIHANEEAKKYETIDPRTDDISGWVQGMILNRSGNSTFIIDGKCIFTLSEVYRMGLNKDPPTGANSVENREVKAILKGLFGEPIQMRRRGIGGRYYVTECNPS